MAWLQGLVEREGLVRGSWNAMRSLWELSFDYLPSRKRMRYGDIDYDFDHGVNTTWAAPSLAVRLREVFTRGRYQPSEPGRFHEILEALVIDYERFVFLDLGSGKGRTLLMASDYPFRRVIGVEVIPELHAIAEENVRRYRNGAQKCSAIETWVGDAREFPFPQDPTVVYLFNPFPGDVLRKVLERLKESLDASPRDCWVIYHNLVHEEVFREMKWLRQELGNDQYAIHRVQMSG
jgi:SAM-dependent methyltransferase